MGGLNRRERRKTCNLNTISKINKFQNTAEIIEIISIDYTMFQWLYPFVI